MHYNKLTLSLLFIVTSTLTDSAPTTRAARLQEAAHKATQQYAVAWDLDGVLFHPIEKSVYLKALWHISPLRVWGPAFRQYKNHGKGSINTWRLLCLQAGDTEGAQFFEQIMRSKKIFPDTQKIIQRLHKQGYKLFYASNMSQDEIELHRTETESIFSCFIDGMDIDDSPGKTVYKKPDSRYFQELKKRMEQICGLNVNFIFIDDRHENVEAARKHGFIAIHCKHPENLWKQLREAGIRF